MATGPAQDADGAGTEARCSLILVLVPWPLNFSLFVCSGAWDPAAGDTEAQVSFLVDKPRSFSLNLTTLVPPEQLVRILQDPGEALVSRYR